MKAHEDMEAVATANTVDDAEEEMVQYPFIMNGQRIFCFKGCTVPALCLQRIRRKRDDPDEDVDDGFGWPRKQARSLILDCSEIGDDRPLSGCSFSDDGKFALNRLAKIWSMLQVNKVSTLEGHTESATDCILSCHLDLLACIAFLPSGNYLRIISFDKTWRLWDVDTAFHHDGFLIGSCGLDAFAHVWDLHSGRSIMALEGHIKTIATVGEDNTCRIWDLRKKKSLYITPAHLNLLSQLKFELQESYYLVTASYAGWSGQDFKPVNTFSAHEAKVSSVDVGAGHKSTISHLH
ncbi:hypothetical protein K2173_005610 [Erythroxylum novogranatense]|uniref:Uncharacterized protein n=1 Tax=Erythroxylum novogranatense TaxID=1862640 RepID=A0AAV8T6B0_9ROSI|nr:hypothetical protein K2173_005610 [Erythroxylum novogranatense]